MKNIVGNWFWLVTLVVSVVAWFIQLAGIASLQNQFNQISRSSNQFTGQLGTGWWNIALEFALICSVIFSLSSGNDFRGYRMVFIGLLALSLSYISSDATLTNAISFSFANSGNRAGAAASSNAYLAGLIMMAISFISWIFAIGSDDDTKVQSMIQATQFWNSKISHSREITESSNNNRSQDRISSTFIVRNKSQRTSQRDTTQSIHRIPSRPDTLPTIGGQLSIDLATVADTDYGSKSARNTMVSTAPSSRIASEILNGYKRQVRGLYTYTASPDDPNEVSFMKGEVMEVMDDKGKWWQVKKDDGSIGIAPSNYLENVD